LVPTLTLLHFLFHFRHRAANDRDAIDERKKQKPKSKTTTVVERDEELDSDMEEWNL
jgi:hypothetical protein